jgi:hypothetical protein
VTACEQAIDWIHAELDGALEAPSAESLAEHVSRCRSCRGLREDLAHLVVRAQHLPRELPPPTDLWPQIRARLRRPEQRSRRSWPWAAGGLLMAAAATLVVLADPPWTEPQPTVTDELAAWEDTVRGATTELEAALAARQDEMDPETLAIVTRNLRIIDAAIEETREALAQKPSDEAGRAALAALHQHKLQLLRQVVDLSRSG